jgi:hypothetical protein
VSLAPDRVYWRNLCHGAATLRERCWRLRGLVTHAYHSAMRSAYIKVAWLRELPDEPVMLYSELDHERNETRKVEVFDDGHMEWAGQSQESGTTGLSQEPIPDLAEIGADSEFVPSAISAEEFEAVWSAAQNSDELASS